MIFERESQAIFATMDALLADLDPPERFDRMLRRALVTVREACASSHPFLPIDMPMAVADVLDRSDNVTRVSAAACVLLWAGADLMDDHADDELDTRWTEASSHQLMLVASNLLATFPHLVVDALELCDDRIEARFGQAVARTLWVMSTGQFEDLESERAVCTVEDYVRVIRRKTGAEISLFAAAPALLSDLPDEAAAEWVGFGFAYGAMAQAFTDTVSTFVRTGASDLRRGKRTLPVLHTLDALTSDRRPAFERDLADASMGEDEAIRRVQATMSEQGAISASLATVESLRRRAAERLPIKLTSIAIGHPLRTLLTGYSLLGRPGPSLAAD